MQKLSGRDFMIMVKMFIIVFFGLVLFTGAMSQDEKGIYFGNDKHIWVDLDVVTLVQGGQTISYLAILTAKEKRYKEELQVGDCLLLFKKGLELEEYTEIAEYDISQVNPWTVRLGEMDGDEELDIFIGAYRATEFYPEAKRPFLLTWNGEFIQKKWTGSYLNYKDFLTAEFRDINSDGKDELVVLEGEEDRGYSYGAYIYAHHTLYPIPIQKE